MKKNNLVMLKSLLMAVMLSTAAGVWAANQVVTVDKITSARPVNTDIDLVITDAEPFSTGGSVDLISTEHAAVIIQKVKPSKVLANWLDHIYIKGEAAKDGENCQVKMYNRGTIILPYGKDFHPLTCYTEDGCQGESCSTYTEGHSGGFMKTLTPPTLNNKIRSFRLKRGYMVTFALGTGGWGYSRCFIAHNEDLEMNLPLYMAQRVSSYRLFKWHYAHKAGLASDSRVEANAAVGASWCYDWAQGNESTLPDVEWVPNHIYEDWPSPSTCGSRSGSCHMKTNNEPGNSADDHPQTVNEVLDNWQNLMRTGMRLCSESSHDGSWNHLRAFIDSIDARGWRCDLLDLHCYWTSGFDNMQYYYNTYGKRPIWISEWVWGASWNNNGNFSSSDRSGSQSNQQRCLANTRPILEALNSSKYVERYAYWNSEADCSKIYLNGKLTLLGEYYAAMDEGIGYDASVQKIPNYVTRPSKSLKATYNEEKHTTTLTWMDPNGDALDSMVVSCKRPGKTQFTRVASIPLKDANSKDGAFYSFEDTPEMGINTYRVTIYQVGSRTPKHSGTVTSLVVDAGSEWQDVTADYLINAGFDTSSDFQQSNLATGVSNHKAVTGWITTCTSEWGASAVFPVGSSYVLNTIGVPAKNQQGSTTGGVLGFTQGWGTTTNYMQEATLPAGTYRMTYAVYNAANAVEVASNSGYKVSGQAAVYDQSRKFNVGAWTESTLMPFVLTRNTKVTFSVGFTAVSSTSITNPVLFFDYVKLEKLDTSTGIADMKTQQGKATATVYDLNGRPLQSPRRGINIISDGAGNARKVMVQ